MRANPAPKCPLYSCRLTDINEARCSYSMCFGRNGKMPLVVSANTLRSRCVERPESQEQGSNTFLQLKFLLYTETHACAKSSAVIALPFMSLKSRNKENSCSCARVSKCTECLDLILFQPFGGRSYYVNTNIPILPHWTDECLRPSSDNLHKEMPRENKTKRIDTPTMLDNPGRGPPT